LVGVVLAEEEGVHAQSQAMDDSTTVYDICIAWNWEYDADFVGLIGTACESHRLSLLQVVPDNLADVLQDLAGQRLGFRVFLDRASDSDACFLPLVQWARDHAAYRINPYEQARRAWDKAAMHSAFIEAGLHAPRTIILPPHEEQPDLPPVDLDVLGDSLAIKPARGGGGEGVILEATSFDQVLAARQDAPADKYLLQAHVVPAALGSRPAWFRVIYCAGQVYPCWWDPETHIYAPVTSAEESGHHLEPLREIAVSIARLCGLDLFSSEVALTPERRFAVVDYVNDPLDLRLQSKAADGVPDEIVRGIAERLVSLAETQIGLATRLGPRAGASA
jgi:hypothetical protein